MTFTGEPADRSVAKLRRTQPRIEFSERDATANNNPALPERSDTVTSPRFAAIYRLAPKFRLWGDVGWGFRAPTLNELYRQFRVGTVLTLANNQLGPERLFGGEIGVTAELMPQLTWRATWFDNRVEDPVANVTISTSGANVTQQRQNLGRTRVSGVQTDVDTGSADRGGFPEATCTTARG